MPQLPSIVEMLKSGVHFGHQSSRWHPKMKPFIFGTRGGVHIVDVEKTQTQMIVAAKFVVEMIAKGGTILFVGTKRQAREAVAAAAKNAGMPYVTERWLGGTLTNWPQIQRLIRHYLDLRDKREKGELRKYTKLEQLNFDREIEELEEKIGGISTLTRIPDALFIVDARTEKTAVREALSVNIPLVGLIDTNVNPTGIRYVIPGNDDAIGSITMVVNLMAEAVKEGKAQALRLRTEADERNKRAAEEARAKAETRANAEAPAKETPTPIQA